MKIIRIIFSILSTFIMHTSFAMQQNTAQSVLQKIEALNSKSGTCSSSMRCLNHAKSEISKNGLTNINKLLLDVASAGSPELIEILLDAGANIEYQEEKENKIIETPLYRAYQSVNVAGMKLLIDRQAQLKFPTKIRCRPNQDPFSGLLLTKGAKAEDIWAEK
jgi:hypothetical protein